MLRICQNTMRPKWLERFGDPFTIRGDNNVVHLSAKPHPIHHVLHQRPTCFSGENLGGKSCRTEPGRNDYYRSQKPILSTVSTPIKGQLITVGRRYRSRARVPSQIATQLPISYWSTRVWAGKIRAAHAAYPRSKRFCFRQQIRPLFLHQKSKKPPIQDRTPHQPFKRHPTHRFTYYQVIFLTRLVETFLPESYA